MTSIDMASAAAGAALSVLPALAAGAGVASLRWRRTASTDRLTGISNRAGLPALSRVMARRTRRSPVAVIALDVRHFKTINDTHGHDTGDMVLRAIADRLTTHPATIGVVRLGGDEFAAVIGLQAGRGPGFYSHRLLDLYAHVTQPVTVPASTLSVDVTIGATLAHRGDTNLTRLLSAADTAMYAARRAGLSLRIVYGPLPVPAARPKLRRRNAHTAATRAEVAAGTGSGRGPGVPGGDRMTRHMAKYDDPEGRVYGLPTYTWRSAPAGLATRRQLRAMGLCPGGQDIAAQVMWRGVGGDRVAYLYRTDLARPKRKATPAVLAAISKALTARRTCVSCGQVRPYFIPTSLGECLHCAYPEHYDTAGGAA